MEHNFQLVITRVYEDGDQELLEDEEESECAVLLIPQALPWSRIGVRTLHKLPSVPPSTRLV